MLEEKIEEYLKKFGENVPVFQLPSMTQDELIALIDKSLESGEPIEAEDSGDPNVHY